MSNNDLPCSKCRGQHHPADRCIAPEIKDERVYCDRDLCATQLQNDEGCDKCIAGEIKDDREKLVKELGELVKPFGNGIQHKLSYTMKRWEFELVSDFIIEREKALRDELVKDVKHFEEEAIAFQTMANTYKAEVDELKRQALQRNKRLNQQMSF